MIGSRDPVWEIMNFLLGLVGILCLLFLLAYLLYLGWLSTIGLRLQLMRDRVAAFKEEQALYEELAAGLRQEQARRKEIPPA